MKNKNNATHILRVVVDGGEIHDALGFGFRVDQMGDNVFVSFDDVGEHRQQFHS